MATPRTEAESASPHLLLDSPRSPSSGPPSSTPASAQTPSGSLGDASRVSSRRGKITQIACVACRQRKSKCDGVRPVCQACQRRPNSSCVYDVTLDQRKPSSLRQRVGELEIELGNFREVLDLLLHALPDRLKPRFQGFVQSVEDGGMSTELLDDARKRLVKPPTPDDIPRSEEMGRTMDRTMDHESSKFDYASGHTTAARPNSSDVSYFFGSRPTARNDDGSDVKMYGNSTEFGPGMSMAQDAGGSDSDFWGAVGNQVWNDSPGTSQERSSGMAQPTEDEGSRGVRRNYSWNLSASNPMRTLHLYGKLDSAGTNDGQGAMNLDMHIPVNLIHPLNEDDDQPLSGMYSGVYAGYRESKRLAIRNGASIIDVFGSPEMDFRAAVEATAFHNELPLSVWASELFGAHRNLRSSDRVACAWLVSTLMRIVPTRENYEALPVWLRPTPKQCFAPHASNLDYLPWPQIRDALIDAKNERVEVTVNALSVNWPYADSTILNLQQDDRLSLTPAFENHISALENWTLAGSLLAVLPNLNGLARFDNDR